MLVSYSTRRSWRVTVRRRVQRAFGKREPCQTLPRETSPKPSRSPCPPKNHSGPRGTRPSVGCLVGGTHSASPNSDERKTLGGTSSASPHYHPASTRSDPRASDPVRATHRGLFRSLPTASATTAARLPPSHVKDHARIGKLLRRQVRQVFAAWLINGIHICNHTSEGRVPRALISLFMGGTSRESPILPGHVLRS